MFVRLILSSLCFYTSIILPVTPPRPLKKKTSNPPEVIMDNPVDQEITQNKQEIPQAPPIIPSKEILLVPKGKQTEVIETLITDYNDTEKELPLEKKEGWKIFRNLFVKQIERADKSASVLHLALNDSEDYLTITVNKNIFVYSAITGEYKKTINCSIPISTARFVNNNDILELRYAPGRKTTYLYIHDEEPLIINDPIKEIPNTLWASIDLTEENRSDMAEVHDIHFLTNRVNIKKLDKKEKLDYLVLGTKIIKGKKRWITIEKNENDSSLITIYNIDAFINSEGYVSPDTPPQPSSPFTSSSSSESEGNNSN